MGNLHGLLQTHPIVSLCGVALPVRDDRQDAFWAELRAGVPSYMRARREVPAFTIHNVNIGSQAVRDPDRQVSYLILVAGGKWGYREDYWERVAELAPLLEDARWYFDDEYTGFVEEFVLREGRLGRQRVVAEGAECWDHVKEAHQDDHELIFELHRQDALSSEEFELFEEALDSMRSALALRPAHLPSKIDVARLASRLGRHDEALGLLQDALVELDRLLEAGEDLEGNLDARQKQTYLELGRAERGRGRHEEALAAFSTADEIIPTWGNHEARLERARLLQTLGRSAEAEEELRLVLARSQHKRQLSAAYFELARVHLGRDEPELARLRLEQLLELGPGWQQEDAARKLLARL